MNGGDKLVKGLSDNEAIVESTVNILISDVVVTEGGSGVVVTAVGVISDSKLLSVIRFITLLVERLVMDTTSDGVIKDGALDGISDANDVTNVTVEPIDNIRVLDCITVSVSCTVSVLNVLVIDGRVLLGTCMSSDCIEEDDVKMAVEAASNKESVRDSVELTNEIKLLIGSKILVDITSVLSTVEDISDTNNVSVVSKLLCIPLETITLVILMSAGSDIVDEGVMIVVKLPIVTTSVDSVNSIIELVTG